MITRSPDNHIDNLEQIRGRDNTSAPSRRKASTGARRGGESKKRYDPSMGSTDGGVVGSPDDEFKSLR